MPTVEAIDAAVRRTKNWKAPGEDGATAELLKAGGLPATEWLTRIVQQLFEGSDPPNDWRQALLIPLFKNKGSALEADNYRGISVLSVPGKF